MNEFWAALLVFVILGLTPVTVATVANRRQRVGGEGERAPK